MAIQTQDAGMGYPVYQGRSERSSLWKIVGTWLLCINPISFGAHEARLAIVIKEKQQLTKTGESPNWRVTNSWEPNQQRGVKAPWGDDSAGPGRRLPRKRLWCGKRNGTVEKKESRHMDFINGHIGSPRRWARGALIHGRGKYEISRPIRNGLETNIPYKDQH